MFISFLLSTFSLLLCAVIISFIHTILEPDQSGVEMELVESQPLLEWLANNYKSFGATLEIITDKSQEGSQFVRGFGGIGGQYTQFIQINYKLILIKLKTITKKKTIIESSQNFGF